MRASASSFRVRQLDRGHSETSLGLALASLCVAAVCQISYAGTRGTPLDRILDHVLGNASFLSLSHLRNSSDNGGARVLFSLGQLSSPITLFPWTGRSHTSPRVPFRLVKS